MSQRKLRPLLFLHEVDPSKMYVLNYRGVENVSALMWICEEFECVDMFHCMGDVTDRSSKNSVVVISRIRCGLLKFGEVAAF